MEDITSSRTPDTPENIIVKQKFDHLLKEYMQKVGYKCTLMTKDRYDAVTACVEDARSGDMTQQERARACSSSY